MTRPRAASEAFVRLLPKDASERIRPVFAPLIGIVACNAKVPMGPDDAAIFTSFNGVGQGPNGLGRRAYCVGPATTSAARKRGWNARELGETANELVAALLQERPDQRLFHLSGTHTRGDVASRLAQAGLLASNIAVYDQTAFELSDEACALLSRPRPVLVPLFSPRTASLFAAAAPAPATNCASVIALSDTVAQALGSFCPVNLSIASAPNADAMCDAVVKASANISSG